MSPLYLFFDIVYEFGKLLRRQIPALRQPRNWRVLATVRSPRKFQNDRTRGRVGTRTHAARFPKSVREISCFNCAVTRTQITDAQMGSGK